MPRPAARRPSTAEPLEFRRLRAADAAIWRDIRLEALKTAPAAFGALYETWANRPLRDFADWLEKGPLYAALDAGQAIGTLGWYRTESRVERHRATIVAAYVRPSARGQSLSEKLFAAIRSDLPEDILQLELEVAADNLAAITVYRRLGFETTGRFPRAARHGDAFVDRLFMVRRLDA